MEIIQIFKALSDETRLRILNILNKQTLCVCDIEKILTISQVNASRHLLKLKNANLIHSEKNAQWVYYALNTQTLQTYPFLHLYFTKSMQESIFLEDLNTLENYHLTESQC